MRVYSNAGGISSECGGGQHGSCPGYYRVTHPCGCPCHQRPVKNAEPSGPGPAMVDQPKQPYRDVIHNSVLRWAGRGHARLVTADIVEALRGAGYVVVWAENLARPA
jgi:hypothetical protein